MDLSSQSSFSISLTKNEDASKLQNLNTLGAILLGIFTIVSFVGNILLITTVASSYQLRQTIFNYFVVNITLANLIDTSVNLVLSMLYVSTGQWQLGRGACVFNSFVQQLVLIETLAAVLLLTIDRAIALQSISRYADRLTTTRSCVLICGVWAIGIIVSLPLITMWSEPNRYRYFCCNYANNPLGYPLSILIICFAIPLFVVFLSLGAIFWRAHEERLRRRAMLPERLADYTDFIVDNRRTQKHMELSKYSAITFLVYFLLQGPYVALNFYGQIRNSLDLVKAYGGRGPMITGDAETSITWLKSLFPVCFPFLTFCLSKDIWRKFKDLVCCRRTNVVTANAFSSSLDAATVAAIAAGQVGQCAGGGVGGYGYNSQGLGAKEMAHVVTIVPTSAGIHQIRPGNDRCEYADVPQMSAPGHRRSRDSQNPRRVRPSNSGGRTSDYDSDGSETSPIPDQQENPRRNQRRKIEASDQPSTSQGSTLRSNSQNALSPASIDPIQHEPSDGGTQIGKKSIDENAFEKSNSLFDDWPTVFRPKSATSNNLALKNEQQVNPGSVPSPDKSKLASRRKNHEHDEARRSSLEDKLKSILHEMNDEEESKLDKEPNSILEKSPKMGRQKLPPLNAESGKLENQKSQEGESVISLSVPNGGNEGKKLGVQPKVHSAPSQEKSKARASRTEAN